MTESIGVGARARLFLTAFAVLAITAISHPSLGAGATYATELEPGTTSLAADGDVATSAPATEEPTSTGLVASEDPAEAPAPEPLPEPPVAEPLPVELPVAEAPLEEIAPPIEQPPLETPTAEPVDTGEVPPLMTEGLENPAIGAPVPTLPTAPEITVEEDPALAPGAEPGQSVVIQTSTEREPLRPITRELRAVLLADAPSRLTRLADVPSAGTTTRTASGRAARGPVERPVSEVRWPLELPPPSEAPVPSRVAFTFNGQAPTGSIFRGDLALALSAVAIAFSLMARVARPVSSRFHEATLVARIPQPG